MAASEPSPVLKKGTRSTSVAILLMLAQAAAFAAPPPDSGDADAPAEPPAFTLRGFGTVGIAHSSESRADFISTDFQKHGTGYTRSWSAEVDSRIGVQMDAALMKNLNGVVQVVSEQQSDGSYRPRVEWANVKYDFTPDLSARVGRFVLSPFMASDNRKVGYSYVWVRPPVEVYTMMPMTRTNGIELLSRSRFGNATNNLEIGFGGGKDNLQQGPIKWNDGWGILDTLDYGKLSFHAAYVRTRLTIHAYDPVFDAYRLFGAAGEAIADKYDVDDKPSSLLTLGASYDPGKWFAMAEWGKIQSDSLLGKRQAWQMTGGFRYGKVTPYLTYSRATVQSSGTADGLPYPQAAALNAALNQFLFAAPEQRTVSLGMRTEVSRNVAFKIQLDRSRVGSSSVGTLVNTQSDFTPGGTYHVISATLDFLF